MDFHSLFPLKEGNCWTYRTDRGKVAVSVVERQAVCGKNFYTIETRVENEVLQREKYFVDADSIWLLSRVFSDKQTVHYDPPNPILAAPAEVSKGWEWKGRCGDQPMELHFLFSEKNVLRVPGGTFPSIKLEIEEKGMGSKSRTFRWYSQGVGMIVETVVSDLMNYEAELETYKLS